MIISGGENIYPAEVERGAARACRHHRCGVIGRPDARWDEVPIAYVIRRKGSMIDAAGLQAHVQLQLARFKVPREFVFVEDCRELRWGRSAFHAEADRRKDACAGRRRLKIAVLGRGETAHLQPRGILRCRAMTYGCGGATPSRSQRRKRRAHASW